VEWRSDGRHDRTSRTRLGRRKLSNVRTGCTTSGLPFRVPASHRARATAELRCPNPRFTSGPVALRSLAASVRTRSPLITAAGASGRTYEQSLPWQGKGREFKPRLPLSLRDVNTQRPGFDRRPTVAQDAAIPSFAKSTDVGNKLIYSQ